MAHATKIYILKDHRKLSCTFIEIFRDQVSTNEKQALQYQYIHFRNYRTAHRTKMPMEA